MFQMFEFTLPMLTMLPVEMWALILRYLDRESLLSAALTNKQFMRVCRGDPVLKQRIRLQVKKEKEDAAKAILDTKMGFTVNRGGSARRFGSNTQKSVKMEKVHVLRRQRQEQPKVLEARSYTILPQAERDNGGGKVRRDRRPRVKPYKIVRF